MEICSSHTLTLIYFYQFNFVGRIIGPRGLTLRQVEQETACKLLVRGRGSMKDKKVEDERRGQPNYEHLDEDLHVLIMVEDTEERARLKLQKTVEEVNFLLTPPVRFLLSWSILVELVLLQSFFVYGLLIFILSFNFILWLVYLKYHLTLKNFLYLLFVI